MSTKSLFSGGLQGAHREVSIRQISSGNLPERWKWPIPHSPLVRYRQQRARPAILFEQFPASLRVDGELLGTPLHIACESRRVKLEVVEFLLERNPEGIYHVHESVGQPLHCAMRGDKDIFIRLYLRYAFSEEPPLVGLMMNRRVANVSAVAEYMMEEFDDVNLAKSRQGENVLHLSVSTVVTGEFFEKLHGMDVSMISTSDNQGRLPLHAAVFFGDPSNLLGRLIELFPEAVNRGDKTGLRPIHVAARRGHLNCVRVLSEANADAMLAVDDDNEVALNKACRGGHFDLVQFLADERNQTVRMANRKNVYPVLLLSQSSGKDREKIDELRHIESIWKLMKAFPDPILSFRPSTNETS